MVVSSNRSEEGFKYILIWYLTWYDYNWKYGDEMFRKCPETRCYLTPNRTSLSSVEDFDAILFHQWLWNVSDIPDPSKRKQTQRYVQWMFEAPVREKYYRTSPGALNNFYNWTVSYRKDSTFPTPYGKVVQKETFVIPKNLQKFISKFGEDNPHIFYKSDLKADGVAFISNCKDKSGRMDVIKELRQYISIDIFGKCSDQNMTCEKSKDRDCLDTLNSSYKAGWSILSIVKMRLL